MALSSANQVAQTVAVDNTARNSAFAATGAPAKGVGFTDVLDAVLAKAATPGAQVTAPGAQVIAPGAKTAANDDTDNKASAQLTALAKLKSKLKNGTPDAAANAQAALQQAAIHKLEATNTNIDLPALRAAMGRDAKTQPAAPATQTAVRGTNKATQEKLAVALAKAADAPVLKTGTTDGSAVPNKKIDNAADAKTHGKPQANAADTVAALAAKIAATSAMTNASDTAPTAAKGVAAAEVATHQAAAAPVITKIEAAAVSKAAATALHAATPQAKLEAQALPIQFDATSANTDDGKSDAQSDSDKSDGDKNGGKDTATAGSTRAAGMSGKQPDTAQTAFSDAQQTAPQNTASASQPVTSQHTTATPTSNITAANGTVPAPATSGHIATALQVAQPAAHDVPQQTPDLAALGVSIAAKSKDGEKQFDIKMDPAELGRVDVRISVDADGKAQAHLAAEKPQTLQLLQNDRTTLERSLRDAGLDLSNNGLNFSLKGEQQPATPTFVARSRALSIATVQTADAISSHSGSSIAPGDSRLDIRV